MTMKKVSMSMTGAAVLVAAVAVLSFWVAPSRADTAWLEARIANPKLRCRASDRFTIIVHGGAFWGDPPGTTRRTVLRDVAVQAARWLDGGAPALAVVEEAVAMLEDSGAFNAGKGANANAKGVVELDAGIMDGRTRRAGAVAAVRSLKNPVRAARLVMTWTPHVMLSGVSADEALSELGAETVDTGYFERTGNGEAFEEKGTVGAVALDRCGDLAAATSTGGFGAKLPGRIGDSPIPGAGLFAENGLVAIAATGHGESFLQTVLSHEVAARMRYGGETLDAAVRGAILETLASVGGEGGLVAVDAAGNAVSLFNSDGMLSEMMSSASLTDPDK
ncbi:isoaspartyl peptidase/L-asparaginase family protein [Pseudoruegeria sp. HB172150]|uniref:isoaspartyl peptidase/L-asparaginase family protein n=1 Tax=Pseudoruegeria sp. HB172150 TaxID=2721164 RepID=UPI00155265AE|nr:isoaspartyl peptidase/L-asparaginase [Pseudoruegeria sp. HB172150]